MGPGVTERADQVIELDHRRRIAVGDQQRQRVRLRRADVQVVDWLPVDLGDELWNLVESGLLGSPVEAVAPVIGQLLEVGQGTPRAKSVRLSGAGSAQRVASRRRWRSSSSESVISIWNGLSAVAVVMPPR